MSNVEEELKYLHLKCDYLLKQNQILQGAFGAYLGVLCNDLNEFSGNHYNTTVHGIYRDTLAAFESSDREWDREVVKYKEIIGE